MRRMGISPNAAEGKERLGLKDLAGLASQKENEKGNTIKETVGPITKGKAESPKTAKTEKQPERPTIRKGKKRFEKKFATKNKDNHPNNSPVKKQAKNTPASAAAATPVSTEVKATAKPVAKTEVKPEVEYQEKSTVVIRPSHEKISLSTPIPHTEDFAQKDNSVDGFLSIKH